MKKLPLLTSGIAICAASMAHANDELMGLMDDPTQWAIQTGDYENQRYSELDQINADNIGDLQVAWTFRPACCAGMRVRPS